MTTIQETKQEKAVRLINQRLPKVRKGILKGILNKSNLKGISKRYFEMQL